MRFRALLNFFGSMEIAWQAPREALLNAGLSPRIVENLQQVRSQIDLEHIWQKIQANGIIVLTWEDEAYPSRLREIDQPPPVLYLRGSLKAEDDWSVAVVGTRRVTAYGRQVTEDVGNVLAQSGVTVISGLARGVDSIAHQAALRAGGRTIAVLGCGVDLIYPPEHRKLAEEIMAHGALLSDYPPGTQPDSANFPPRNRIISGLALATVVIEAGETSGALITATFAAEQGREVFAVPGSILAAQSRGTNRLIRDGATPMLNPRDILEILNLKRLPEQRAARQVLPADAVEARLMQTLGTEPMHVDEISAQTGLPIEKVTASLVVLELKGLVRQVGGMNYVSIREDSEPYERE